MQFSIKMILSMVVLGSVLFYVSYSVAQPFSSWILCLISLVIPPFIVVGTVVSRGARRAFFGGCLISGMVHFIANSFYGVLFAVWMMDNSTFDDPTQYFFDEESSLLSRSTTLIFYGIALAGGLSGWTAYQLFAPKQTPTDPGALSSDSEPEPSPLD